MTWCSTSLFHFRNGVRSPVKGLVDAGAEPVFAFYLQDRGRCKMTINGVNRMNALHGKLRVHELRESFALLASEKTR